MATCKICLKQFKTLRFQSPRVCVCGRCTNDLNNYKEVAEGAYKAARELLLTGMLRRATIDVSVSTTPLWKQQRAEHILGNIEVEVDRALPKWINKLVADESNGTKIFKIIRAHRRGLLHLDRPNRWGYPKNWKEVAHNIRVLDNFTCVSCSATGGELHVHHIVYASNFGTHQKTNLVTLCRSCHEKEHKRVFDFGENMEATDEPPLELDEGDSNLIAEGMKLAGFYIEAGTRSFTEYAKLMIEDIGDGVKPYLLSFWEAARNYPGLDTSGMTSVAESARQFERLIKPNVEAVPASDGALIISITRDAVNAQDVSSVLDALRALISSPEVALAHFEKVEISFHGYDHMPEEFFELQEVRDYVYKLDEKFPYWLFFLDKTVIGLQNLAYCFLPPFLTQEAKKELYPERLNDLLTRRWFPAMNQICEWVGFTEEQIEVLTDRSVTYLLGGPIAA